MDRTIYKASHVLWCCFCASFSIYYATHVHFCISKNAATELTVGLIRCSQATASLVGHWPFGTRLKINKITCLNHCVCYRKCIKKWTKCHNLCKQRLHYYGSVECIAHKNTKKEKKKKKSLLSLNASISFLRPSNKSELCMMLDFLGTVTWNGKSVFQYRETL